MRENNIIGTYYLDKAAFLIIKGGVLLGFVGPRAHDCKLTVETNEYALEAAKAGLINFKHYMRVRKKLKIKIKKAYGIYES